MIHEMQRIVPYCSAGMSILVFIIHETITYQMEVFPSAVRVGIEGTFIMSSEQNE